jgi:hypothetical protein
MRNCAIIHLLHLELETALRKVNGRWIQAYRVHKKDSQGEIIQLLEEVPKEFPRDQDGKVNWNFF